MIDVCRDEEFPRADTAKSTSRDRRATLEPLAVRTLQTSALEEKLHRADKLRERERRQEETISEFAIPTFAESDGPWKYREVQISTASTEDSNSKRELDRRLDLALEDTFPASDPVSIVISV